MHRRYSFFKEVLDESSLRIARLWKVLSREKRGQWYQVRANPHWCWWYGIVSHNTEKWVIGIWVESSTQLGIGGGASSTEVWEHRTPHNIVWSRVHGILSGCLELLVITWRSRNGRKAVVPHTLFWDFSFPLGFLPFLFSWMFLSCSCWSHVTKRFLTLRTPEGDVLNE